MRTKVFRRQKRKTKIRRRQQMAVCVGRHGKPYTVCCGRYFNKIESAIHGSKQGIFDKYDYEAISRGATIKTRSRRRYGKVLIYSRHDLIQIERMKLYD